MAVPSAPDDRKIAGRLDWPPNLWMGVSVENDRYTFRGGHLRQSGAVVRFLSCEPLLGPLPSLSLDGIAKGYIVEKACAVALAGDKAVQGLLLNVGGDIRVEGPHPLAKSGQRGARRQLRAGARRPSPSRESSYATIASWQQSDGRPTGTSTPGSGPAMS